MARHLDLGRWGESCASAYLEQHGFVVLERNWRHSSGEIDLIASFGATLVFVEVKTRSSLACGHPFEAITPSKCARLYRLALAWRLDHNYHGPYRIDAIAVTASTGGQAVIEHLEAVYA